MLASNIIFFAIDYYIYHFEIKLRPNKLMEQHEKESFEQQEKLGFQLQQLANDRHDSSFVEEEEQQNQNYKKERQDQDYQGNEFEDDEQMNVPKRNPLKMEEPGIFVNDQGQEFKTYDPNFLQSQFDSSLPDIVEKPINRKKHKGTNIPKFLLKVFFNNIPQFPGTHHKRRLQQFAKRPQKSKTRFHLNQLFGVTTTTNQEQIENELNRRVLKRLLNRNYDNILTNKHIRNKRLYLLFCKKMMLRLNKPQLIDRLEI